MVGMRDVAKKAGVSLSSVSLVINGTGYVSQDMRDKVEQAMRELNYVPNELARNFYHGKTGIVGVIVPTIQHPFFATLTAHLQREFAARSLRTMLCSTVDSANGEAQYVEMLRQRSLDALVVAAHTTHDTDYWTSIGRPIVAFDRNLGAHIAQVSSDHAHGGELIADLLASTRARNSPISADRTRPSPRCATCRRWKNASPRPASRTRTSSPARCATSTACGAQCMACSTPTRASTRLSAQIWPPHSRCRRRRCAGLPCPGNCRSWHTTARWPPIAQGCR